MKNTLKESEEIILNHPEHLIPVDSAYFMFVNILRFAFSEHKKEHPPEVLFRSILSSVALTMAYEAASEDEKKQLESLIKERGVKTITVNTNKDLN